MPIDPDRPAGAAVLRLGLAASPLLPDATAWLLVVSLRKSPDDEAAMVMLLITSEAASSIIGDCLRFSEISASPTLGAPKSSLELDWASIIGNALMVASQLLEEKIVEGDSLN
jgi:hypothetical protein